MLLSEILSRPPDTIVDMRLPDSELYKTLFDLSQSIAGHSDLGTLCNSLAKAATGRIRKRKS